MIHPPDYSKDFLLYVAASTTTIRTVIAQEDQNDQEHMIYYASKNILNSETRYSHVEKIALATLISVKNVLSLHLVSHHYNTRRPKPYVLHPDLSGAGVKYSRWIVIL